VGRTDESSRRADAELATVPARPGAEARPVADVADDDAIAMFRAAGADDRYADGELIGQGGMGQVTSADDRATGRTVAVKTMRADQVGPVALRRFAREARIQAQLEHPSIVPVYDVGVDAEGALFFTMKRIRGESLSKVLERIRAGDDEALVRYSHRRLLNVLTQVALTVEYAHQRGVLHRDLKPSNIMLGEFGEVYVLDWGLADVRHPGQSGEPRADEPTPLARLLATAAAAPLVDSSVRPDTASGQLLGTPGYTAPELIEHGSGALDERADVYALGAILYEMLTGERMHAGDALGQVLGSTLELDGAQPAQHTAAVAPELDLLCQRATRRDPAQRLASAAAFARGIEAYLDGDRDLAERRRLADVRAEAAERVLAEPHPDEAEDTAARAAALRDVTTALGLDPEHTGARATLLRLLTEPGPGAVAAAEVNHRAAATKAFQHAALNGILAISTYILYVPLVMWMGMRTWWMLGVMAAAIFTVIGVTYYYYRRPPSDLRLPWPHLVASLFALSTGNFIAGPLLLLPTAAIATGVGYIAAFERRVAVTIASLVAVVLVPFALQVSGVVGGGYRFEGDAIVIYPGMAHFPRTATIVFLCVTHLVMISAAMLFTWRMRQSAVRAERLLRVQAWQLDQIVHGQSTTPQAVKLAH
jgi:serine/threonine protein kinase